MSPGINDPTTALYCIDRLGEALGRLAERDIPSTMRFDEARRLRILTRVTSLEALACPAFAAIARYGMADADVIALLLRSLGNLSRMVGPEASRAIADLSEQIRRESQTKAALDFDQLANSGRGGTTRRGALRRYAAHCRYLSASWLPPTCVGPDGSQ